MQEVRLIDARHLMRTIMDHEISMSVCMTQDEQCGMARMRRMAIEDIDSAPTVDAEPVRHGRWETIDPSFAHVYCSECGAAAEKNLAKRYKGCPFCLCVIDATDTNVGGKGGEHE